MLIVNTLLGTVATQNFKLSFNITIYESIIRNTKFHKCHLTDKTHTSVITEILHETVHVCQYSFNNMITLEFKIKKARINAFWSNTTMINELWYLSSSIYSKKNLPLMRHFGILNGDFFSTFMHSWNLY